MNQAFYAASVAASQQQQRLNVISNNIANINTTAFKSELPQFSELLYQNYQSPNGEQVYRGAGSRMMQTTTNFNGSALDYNGGQSYAISGNGFFAILNPQTNEISYTRAGAFHWGSTENEDEFYLCDPDGSYVLDQDMQPIVLGDDSNAQCPVGVFDFENRNGMIHMGGNKFRPVEKNGPVLPGTGSVMFGVVETSNTDISTQFAHMIETQRSFTYALKMVQTQDEIHTTINSLKG